MNRAVDDVRWACWLWLKNSWILERSESRRLSALCSVNHPIVRVYYLKEEFQRFWDYCDHA